LNLLAQQLVNGVMLGAVYVTVAVAFTLTIGILDFLNFTIPGLFMLSAMLGWGVLSRGWFAAAGALAWVPSLLVGGVGAILVSLLVERFAYRPLKARFGDASEHAIPIVSSLGFLLVIENLVAIYLGTDTQPFPTRFTGASIRVAGVLVSLPQLISLAVAIVLVALLTLLVRRSRIGRALRAIAENRDAATVIGIDVARIVPVVFAVTGLLCAIAGAIYAVNFGQVSSAMGDDVGVKAIAGMVIGGLGSIWGAVAGGLAVGLAEALSIQYLGTDSVTAVVWGLLLLVLLVWPKGLFGSNRVGRGKL
jgi:branched-chain amino acid transport system permease protein